MIFETLDQEQTKPIKGAQLQSEMSEIGFSSNDDKKLIYRYKKIA